MKKMRSFSFNPESTLQKFLSQLRNIVMFSLLMSISGCINPQEARYPVNTLPLSGRYTNVTWLDGYLVVEDTTHNWKQRLWRLAPDGSDLVEMPLSENYTQCIRTGLRSPVGLPDGRLAYMRLCQRSGYGNNSLYAMVYDPETEISEQLTQVELPTAVTPTGSWSWHSAEQKGIASDGVGRGLGEQLFSFTSSNWEYLDLGVEQALGVSWAQESEQIVFFATLNTGESLADYLDTNHSLYLMDLDTGEMQILLEGVKNPQGTSWSLDKRWLAFYGRIHQGLREKSGVWAFDLKTDNLHLIHEGSFGTPAWSLDGKQLAAIKWSDDTNVEEHHIVIFDVGILQDDDR